MYTSYTIKCNKTRDMFKLAAIFDYAIGQASGSEKYEKNTPAPWSLRGREGGRYV